MRVRTMGRSCSSTPVRSVDYENRCRPRLTVDGVFALLGDYGADRPFYRPGREFVEGVLGFRGIAYGT
jgi:hypothetical protein